MTDQRGFSLLELLIVMAIIGVIAAMALPKLSESRKRSQEAAAVATVRSILTAEVQFMIKQSGSRYGTLSELTAEGFIDATLAVGKSGYAYSAVQPRGAGTYDIKAAPLITDLRWFFAREDGRIYVNTVDDFGTAVPIPKF